MGCTLDKFTRYDVAEVLHTGGRVVARLSAPPAGCPDGTLNNSHTVEQESSTVLRPTLTFDNNRGVPVVLVPASYKPAAPAPDADAQASHGFRNAVLLILLVAVLIYLVRKFVRWLYTGSPAVEGGHYASTPSYRGGVYYPGAYTGRANSSVAVVNINENHTTSDSHPNSYNSDTSSSSDTGSSYSSDSSSSYSSDSGSSYSSDSSSSYSSDSSSSFGSDSGSSGSSFGSD